MLHALLFAALMGVNDLAQGPEMQTHAREPVVHVVLFYSPTCPHCERVITDYLIPLKDQYGDRLAMLAFDTSKEFGVALFRAALDHYAIPREGWVVPFMIVGDEVMTGSVDIPKRLPGLLEAGLAEEGIDLPDFPALIEFLDGQGALLTLDPGPRYLYQNPSAAAAVAREPEPPADTAVTETEADVAEEVLVDTAAVEEAPYPSALLHEPPGEVVDTSADDSSRALDIGATDTAPTNPEMDTMRDVSPAPDSPTTRGEAVAPRSPPQPLPSAPSIALELTAVPDPAAATPWTRFQRDRVGNSMALVVLVGLVLALASALRLKGSRKATWPEWATPALTLVGLAVALYLSYVEVTGSPATCGPVGDCNTVQQSTYATLFGVLPVGILGVVGYLAILALWLARNVTTARAQRAAAIGLWSVAMGGTLFSIYLTFLEPFVIGATCIWCLTSAIVMALLLLSAVGPASQALKTKEV